MTTQQAVVTGLVLGIMLGAAGIVLSYQYVTDFGRRRPKRLADLEWLWGMEDGRVSPDTVAVWRAASRLVIRERVGGSSDELLGELDGLEAAMAEVGARLLKVPNECELEGFAESAPLHHQPAPPPARSDTVRSIR